MECPSINPEPVPTRLRRWLLLAALLHGLAYLLLLPPWMGEDEPWHVEYAHHIGRGHAPWGGREISIEDLELYSASQAQVVREIGGLSREEILGTQRELVASMGREHFWQRVDWAGNGDAAVNFDQVSPYLTATHQPPLYYLAVGQMLRFGNGDVLMEMWILRGFSLLAYLAVVLATYELGRSLTNDKWLPLVAAMIAAWWPMHARQAAVVNNDVLVKVFSAWSLVVSSHILVRGLNPRRFALGLALVLLAVGTKSTGVGALIPFGLACVFRPSARRASSRRQRWLGVLLLAAVVAAVPLFYTLSNNPAIPRTLGNLFRRFGNTLQWDFAKEFLRTSVGAFNWYSRDLPFAVQASVVLTIALASLGFLYTWIRRPEGLQRALLLLCLAGLGVQFAQIAMRGVSAGRYAMPMLPAFALLCAVGFLGPWAAPKRRQAAILVMLLLLIFDGIFLWSGLVWNQYGVWGS